MKIANHLLTDGAGRFAPFNKSPNHGGALSPTLIVLHDTASGLGADGPISWLTDPAAKVSAHLVIGRDGIATQLVPFNVVAWHAGKSSWRGRSGCNAFSIGIEIVNPGAMTLHANGKSAIAPDRRNYDLTQYNIRRAADDHHPSAYWMDYTAEQIAAVTQICAVLKAAYEIEAVTTHWEVAPGRKVDTNPFFPLDHLRNQLFGAHDSDGAPEVVAIVEASVRRWPSYADNVIDVLTVGEVVTPIRSGVFINDAKPEPWTLVHAENGVEGWVNNIYLRNV
jgi:N-acetylmuramoyl-L-alanine amidase